ncbi:MAG: SDR family oxidoreductase [Azoarcus sp.]|jgi:uncharacterized protein YbjT (DUF2867 family)|nr:SDR family oxidoreductase [Azoarcus sp.]
MNILLCGADGFLGGAIQRVLIASGHRVIRGVHHPRQPGDITIDYRTDVKPEDWLPHLKEVDGVINAVGILREREAGDFERIHHRAPAALFRACANVGMKKVVQISALNSLAADAQMTPYLASKYAADAALLKAMPENALILRPALTFGTDGDSTRFFMALASLPVLSIPHGVGQVQPVHVEDVAAAVVKSLTDSVAPTRVLYLPGPRAMNYADWIETYRHLMGLPPAPHLPIPAFVMEATARFAGLFRASILCRDTWRMMAQGNCADAADATAFLERPLRDPADFATTGEAEGLRLKAFAVWRRLLLRGVLAAIWLLTALVSAGIFPLFSRAQSLELLAPLGLSGSTALGVLAFAVVLDALMGFLTFARPGRRLWLFQLVLIIGYTVLIAWRLPEFLFHPFGPVLKNLAVGALLIQLFSEEPAKEPTA